MKETSHPKSEVVTLLRKLAVLLKKIPLHVFQYMFANFQKTYSIL